MNQNTSRNLPRETHYHFESLEFAPDSVMDVQVAKNVTTDRFLGFNGYANYSRYPNISDHHCNGELLKGDREKENFNDDALVCLAQYNSVVAQSLLKHSRSISPFDCQYEQMSFAEKLLLELQSVSLHPENVPDLHDKEEDEINQEVIQLQRQLHQQTVRKKMRLDKMHKAIQGQDTCGGDLEHVAMNKLVELAYKKLLANKGNRAIKIGIPKVSKHVALAFARRTLARCRKFEESGVSCFSEPPLRDIVSSEPARVRVMDPLDSICKALANGSFAGPGETSPLNEFAKFGQQTNHAFAKIGPISNRGKKRGVLLDNFVGGSVIRSNLDCSLPGGVKGKRSERDKDKDASMKKWFCQGWTLAG